MTEVKAHSRRGTRGVRRHERVGGEDARERDLDRFEQAKVSFKVAKRRRKLSKKELSLLKKLRKVRSKMDREAAQGVHHSSDDVREMKLERKLVDTRNELHHARGGS